MAIDPRTLREIERADRCHLLPQCFGVSNKAVRLDGDFDNKIGATCDAQLERYFVTMLGDRLRGRIALRGGSKSLSGVVVASKGVVAIRKPRRGKIQDWAGRALGWKDGQVQFESFTGDTVDCAAAFLSMIHSAFVVLHYRRHHEVFDPIFNPVRLLLQKAIDGALTGDDFAVVRAMVNLQFAVPRGKMAKEPIGVNDFRALYDPSIDVGDGVLDAFPAKSVSKQASGWMVTLPYSRSLRGIVTFKKCLDDDDARQII